MKTTTVQLPAALLQRAAATAKRRGISQSKVLREAIQTGLHAETSKSSMAEMMSDVMGCIDGSADASVNYRGAHLKALMRKHGQNSR